MNVQLEIQRVPDFVSPNFVRPNFVPPNFGPPNVGRCVVLALAVFVLAACSSAPSDRLAAIMASGVLVAGGVVEPGQLTPEGFAPVGFEVDLVHGIARELDVDVQWLRFQDLASLVRALAERRIDVAVGVPVGTAHGAFALYPDLRLGAVYDRSPVVVAYKHGSRRPRELAQLEGLTWLQPAEHPVIQPDERTPDRGVTAHQAFALVASGKADALVTTERQLLAMRSMFPRVTLAFSTAPERKRPCSGGARARCSALALAVSADARGLERRLLLHQRALQAAGEMEGLRARHFGFREQFDQASLQTLERHTRELLPTYRHAFVAAASKHELEWPLLAALGYQESKWDPRAVSPTGVQGLMMLTRATASEVGVKDRLDPSQSIAGGARYLGRLAKEFSSMAPAPEHLWLAAGAYNLGRVHIRNAVSAVTRKPLVWDAVAIELALWGKASDARRAQAVQYVRNVRHFSQSLTFAATRDALVRRTVQD